MSDITHRLKSKDEPTRLQAQEELRVLLAADVRRIQRLQAVQRGTNAIYAGEKHGSWVTYYANGNKRSEGHYNLGKKDGLWVQYWPNGSKKSECRFVDDRPVGLYTAYHKNGNRDYQGRYNEGTGASADGTKEGVWCYYAEDGESIWRKITYKRGSRTQPDEIFGDRPDVRE